MTKELLENAVRHNNILYEQSIKLLKTVFKRKNGKKVIKIIGSYPYCPYHDRTEGEVTDIETINGKTYFQIRINWLYNVIDEDFNMLFGIWFDDMGRLKEKYICVGIRDGHPCGQMWHNFISYNGNFIGNKWYKTAYDFINGFAPVSYGTHTYSFINTKGELITKERFIDYENFGADHPCAIVSKLFAKHKMKSIIKQDGTYLIDGWYDGIGKIWEEVDFEKKIFRPCYIATLNDVNYFFNLKGEKIPPITGFWWRDPKLRI